MHKNWCRLFFNTNLPNLKLIKEENFCTNQMRAIAHRSPQRAHTHRTTGHHANVSPFGQPSACPRFFDLYTRPSQMIIVGIICLQSPRFATEMMFDGPQSVCTSARMDGHGDEQVDVNVSDVAHAEAGGDKHCILYWAAAKR